MKYTLEAVDRYKRGSESVFVRVACLGTRDLFRVRAAEDAETPLGPVRRGDIGGYVSGPFNLSQRGTAWLFADSAAVGGAIVEGGAAVGTGCIVRDHARVSDNAVLTGGAKVSGHAAVGDNAVLKGTVIVRDKARVFGDAVLEGGNSSLVMGVSAVLDSGEVSGRARLRGGATVGGNAAARGDAVLGGPNAWLFLGGDAVAEGRASLMSGDVTSNDTFAELPPLPGPAGTLELTMNLATGTVCDRHSEHDAGEMAERLEYLAERAASPEDSAALMAAAGRVRSFFSLDGGVEQA